MHKRYLHPSITSDTEVINVLNKYGANAYLLYTFLLIQTTDDGIVRDASPKHLKMTVAANVSFLDEQDISDLLTILHNSKLIGWDRENDEVWFPYEAFYRYQTDIKAERRRSPDRPFQHKPLKRTRPVVSAELEEKFNSVWAVTPQAWQTYESEYAIKEALKKFTNLSAYDAKLAMLTVREKYLGKRSDVAFLFTNALKWRNESSDAGESLLSYTDYETQYELERAAARQIAEEKKKELMEGDRNGN